MLPRCTEMMDEKFRIENLEEEGYRQLSELLQGSVRDTVRVSTFRELQTLAGFSKLLRFS